MNSGGFERGPESVAPSQAFHQRLTALLLDSPRTEQRADGHYLEFDLSPTQHIKCSSYSHYLHKRAQGVASAEVDTQLLRDGNALLTIDVNDSSNPVVPTEFFWVLRPNDLNEVGMGARIAEELVKLNLPAEEFVTLNLQYNGGLHVRVVDDPYAHPTLSQIVA